MRSFGRCRRHYRTSRDILVLDPKLMDRAPVFDPYATLVFACNTMNLDKVFVGGDLEDAVAFQLAIGPAGEVYREAGQLALERHEEISAALRSQLQPHLGPNGVMMDSSSWKVTARNPS